MVADAPDRVWAVDFQFDVTTDGRPIEIVSIIDEHTRECLGGMVERSITGQGPHSPRGTNSSVLVPSAAAHGWIASRNQVNSSSVAISVRLSLRSMMRTGCALGR